MTLAIEIDNLWISYGSFVAVRGLSLRIPPGEVFGFIGPNGAGKSSTIRVLATLQQQFIGQVHICGVNVRSHPERIRELMGFVPDYFGVYDDLTVREYLHFFAAAYRLPLNSRDATVSDVLQLVDLSHKLDSAVNVLSRGMKQRLSLARVLLHDPQVLLLDEPASGLDPRARIEMRELLKALRDMGKTILISSHILQELAELCSQIGILETGKLVASGSVQDIYALLNIQQAVHVQAASGLSEAATVLQSHPGVARVEKQPDRYVFHLHVNGMLVEDLHELLVAQGVKIRMFQPAAMDMETAFIKLTEGKTA